MPTNLIDGARTLADDLQTRYLKDGMPDSPIPGIVTMMNRLADELERLTAVDAERERLAALGAMGAGKG